MPDKSAPSEPNLEPDILRHTVPPRLKFYGVVGLCVAGVIVLAGLGWRYYSSVRTENWTEDQATPSVQTISIKGAKAGGSLDLPGDIQAFTNAPIYAQVSGTLLKWYVDIGSPVKSGDILAQIDPRPYQAALDQAKGQLAKDQGTLAGAQRDLARFQSLLAVNAESRQVVDDETATVATDSGVVQADQAAVQTATINLGYTRITAPFGGTVTSRGVDTGNLVAVGTASATPLFTVTDQNKLRIYVRVPQIYLGAIKPGMSVDFSVPEYPGRTFSAQLEASAGAVASASGTQLLQFQIDNSSGAIKPGDYGSMHFKFAATAGAIRIPATALLFRDEGMMVATVDAGNHVKLKVISIVTDLGNAVEATGVDPGDKVIDNPSDSLRDGDSVRPSPEPAKAAS